MDTKLELRVRSALHRSGCRYRKNYKIVASGRSVRADVAFPSKKIAVFLDGCFWHRCPDHVRMPKGNSEYWAAKLERNVRRDVEVNRTLRDVGWTVVRIWEHESVDRGVAAVRQALRGPGPADPLRLR